MKVFVRLIGPVAIKLGFNEKELEVPEGTKLEGLFRLLKVEPVLPMIITRNGKSIEPEDKLQNGDRIVIAHAYSGG